jgi:hypothetical protein
MAELEEGKRREMTALPGLAVLFPPSARAAHQQPKTGASGIAFAGAAGLDPYWCLS